MLGLGKKIRELRKKKNITQQELAKQINVHRSVISMYETNVREPSFEILIKLAQYFKVPTDYLLKNNKSDSQINIKEIREIKGFGVNGLSRLSNVNTSYINTLEHEEKQNPTITTLKKIANALEITIDELVLNETNKITNAEDTIRSILYQPSIMQKGNFDISKLNEKEINEFINDILTFIKIIGPKYSK